MKMIVALALLLSVSYCHADFVGIDDDDFRPHYTAQKETMWCWASSAEMVLSYEGVDLPQEAIVTKVVSVHGHQPGRQPDGYYSVR